ncbi:MAG: ComF family protein [Candidatus Sungbacteria bacterium]|uniref:ComF family protein n=1 Tax=Candidatus Sungiibacteriota bacterium TaxID=2750080 RepID=A0A932YZI7_9BACT|nr:ComF family protein [Candidatus Sungbacteria bacterium]
MRAEAVKEWLLDLVFPKSCLGCNAEGAFLCRSCRETLAFRAPQCPRCGRRNFDGVLCNRCQGKSDLRRFLAPFSYREPLARNLIHAYKYEGLSSLKVFFADAIVSFLELYAIRPRPESMLVPIPLHRFREQARGFNQAALLAEELGRRLDLGVRSPLYRRRMTEPQIDMPSYDKRRDNVARAFAVNDPALVRGRTVILVDDVATSGATLSEAARVLRRAGARSVWAIAIAKG